MTTCRAALFFLLLTATAFADQAYRSKLGFDIKGFVPNNIQGTGWLAGARAARYFGQSQVYIGLAAYFGSPNGTDPVQRQEYYGGVTVGYDGRLSKIFVYEFSLLLGYGEAKYNDLSIHEKSYYTIEPNAGIGFGLGGGWRMLFSGGYIHMTDAPSGSGFVFGLRFQYRSGTSVKDIND